MITVQVLINDRVVIARSARNIGSNSDGQHSYLVDDGRKIDHFREEGAAALASKLLEGVVDIDRRPGNQ